MSNASFSFAYESDPATGVTILNSVAIGGCRHVCRVDVDIDLDMEPNGFYAVILKLGL